jgi:hypothetical protein
MSFHSSKLRDARNNLIGIKPIPNDPYSQDRERIGRAVNFSEIFATSVDRFAEQISTFSAINDELVRTLHKTEKLESVLPLSSLRQAVSESRGLFEGMRLHISTFQSKAKAVENGLTERERKYWEKEHYERKIQGLTDDQKLDNDFMDRNVRKRSQAITEFAETGKQEHDFKVLAANVPNFVNESVQKYSECLEQVFSIMASTSGSATGCSKLDDSKSFSDADDNSLETNAQ